MLFADPVSDIAVLGIVDDELLPKQASAYKALTQGKGFSIDKVRMGQPVWALYLDGEWKRGIVRQRASALGIEFSSEIQPGMSGSPVVNANGRAVGIVVLTGDIFGYLINIFPGWLLRDLRAGTKRRKKPSST
jgi:hypothetical protein